MYHYFQAREALGIQVHRREELEKNGFDYDLEDDLRGYERLFLMKDLAAVEDAVSLGAKIAEAEVAF
jgi:hypothetical protein